MLFLAENGWKLGGKGALGVLHGRLGVLGALGALGVLLGRLGALEGLGGGFFLGGLSHAFDDVQHFDGGLEGGFYLVHLQTARFDDVAIVVPSDVGHH